MDLSRTRSPLPPLPALIHSLLEDRAVLNDPATPFAFRLQEGHGSVVAMAGENASGKSLLAQMVAGCAYHDHGVEPMVVSVQARTSEGMLRAFTYGSEQERATGEVSLSVALKALDGLAQRMGPNGAGQALAILDEPDLGLSESYAHAFGLLIAQKAAKLPARGWGLMVVTHSRALMRGLRTGLGQDPTFIHAGGCLTLDEWLQCPPGHTVEDLLSLPLRARARAAEVRSILRRPD